MSNNTTEHIHNGWGIGAFLNRYTGHIVDWNRVGELLKSGHQYNIAELMIRIEIISGTVLGTYILEKLLCQYVGSNIWTYLTAFILSFTICHGLAIEHLITKRLLVKEEIDDLIFEVEAMSENKPEDEKSQISERVKYIMQLEAKNNASSATLGMRRRLLLDLIGSIEP